MRSALVREVLRVYGLTLLGLVVLYGIAQTLAATPIGGFSDEILPLLFAGVFWMVPHRVLENRGLSMERYGWRTRPLGKLVAIGLGVTILVLPIYYLGFGLLQKWQCQGRCVGMAWPPPFGQAPFSLGPLGTPSGLLLATATQLLVIALPEELFFRGYLQGRLSQAFGQAAAVVLSSLLFAFGHFVLGLWPVRLMVFFPALVFGLLAARTGSIVPGAIFHAACNLLQVVLYRTFFP